MSQSNFVSVTELKRQASSILKSVHRWNKKIIMINNKPIAVLAPLDGYELSIDERFEFDFGPEGIDPQSILDGVRKA